MKVSRSGLLSALILMKQQITCFLTLLCNFHFLQQVGNMFFKSRVVIWHNARRTVRITPLLGLGRSEIQRYIGDGARQWQYASKNVSVWRSSLFFCSFSICLQLSLDTTPWLNLMHPHDITECVPINVVLEGQLSRACLRLTLWCLWCVLLYLSWCVSSCQSWQIWGLDLLASLPNHSWIFKVSDLEINGCLQQTQLFLICLQCNITTDCTLQINLCGKDGVCTNLCDLYIKKISTFTGWDFGLFVINKGKKPFYLLPLGMQLYFIYLVYLDLALFH